jgi:hypothetical protein
VYVSTLKWATTYGPRSSLDISPFLSTSLTVSTSHPLILSSHITPQSESAALHVQNESLDSHSNAGRMNLLWAVGSVPNMALGVVLGGYSVSSIPQSTENKTNLEFII